MGFSSGLARFELVKEYVSNMGGMFGHYRIKDVRLRTSGEEMVLKIAKGTGSAGNRRAIHVDAAREAAMLHRLSHENILALRGDVGTCTSLLTTVKVEAYRNSFLIG
ncbi:hypothetical protein NECAME_12113 [Necator americanus]|uniref:Protein kinase domain-containing protein n=1 Tax=Necator americanus TaxID=51031 RepID=W2T2N3_NECAM|nr:hypothetical protein NECAME_12113 [Necator americanus]ETN75804.1 hypothetical protein NECAME_12113 [Necator americanus]